MTETVHDIFVDIQKAIQSRLLATTQPVFLVDKKAYVADTFSKALRANKEMPWFCSTCDSFLNRYGRMVTVNPVTGELDSLLFADSEDYPEKVRAVFEEVRARIERRKIVTLATFNDKYRGVNFIGKKEAGGFAHLHMDLIADEQKVMAATSYMEQTPDMTRNVEVNHHRLIRFGKDYTGKMDDMASAAQYIINSKAHKASQFVASINSHMEILTDIEKFAEDETALDNMRWYYAAAFGKHGRAGFQGTVLGLFFEHFLDGAPERAVEELRDKTSSTKYMHSTAKTTDLSDKHIEGARAKLAGKGFTESLLRRAASTDEPEVAKHAVFIKGPEEEVEQPTDLFEAVKQQPRDSEMDIIDRALPQLQQVMAKSFFEKVVPKAKRIFLEATDNTRGLSWASFMTAANPECKPILKWDSAENRNQVSWSVNPQPYSLTSYVQADLVELKAVHHLPWNWTDTLAEFPYTGYLLTPVWGKRIAEQHGLTIENGLHIEACVGDVFEERKVIEALNNSHVVKVTEMALAVSNNGQLAHVPRFYVEDENGVVTKYELTIWEDTLA